MPRTIRQIRNDLANAKKALDTAGEMTGRAFLGPYVAAVEGYAVELAEAEGVRTPTPRNHHAIRADMVTAQAAYEASVAADAPMSERQAKARVIADLKVELLDSLTPGAEPCETCGRLPIAMRHINGQHRYDNPDDPTTPRIYWYHRFEVGCDVCGNKRAIGRTIESLIGGPELDKYDDATIAAAVKAWNDENYLPPK